MGNARAEDIPSHHQADALFVLGDQLFIGDAERHGFAGDPLELDKKPNVTIDPWPYNVGDAPATKFDADLLFFHPFKKIEELAGEAVDKKQENDRPDGDQECPVSDAGCTEHLHFGFLSF